MNSPEHYASKAFALLSDAAHVEKNNYLATLCLVEAAQVQATLCVAAAVDALGRVNRSLI